MSATLQYIVVAVVVIAAVAYLARYIYKQTRRGGSCGSCPLAGKCSGERRGRDQRSCELRQKH